MSETEVSKKEIIRDGMIKMIKGSEAVATQAVDSTASVLRVGLANAEDLSAKASDILLNTARRAISAGTIVGNDVRDATKDMVKGAIHAASEIGSELKESASTAIQSKRPATKPKKEEAKPE
jgi:hypothetical protein